MENSPIRIATITVSDTRDASTDKSGPVLGDALRSCKFLVVSHVIVLDEVEAIQAIVQKIAESRVVEAIVLTGGTGITERDVTIEALRAIWSKELDGFGEAFRQLSWKEIGARAMLSRAAAGVVGKCVVFALPGSVKAVKLAANELIAPVLEHAVGLLMGRGHPEKTA